MPCERPRRRLFVRAASMALSVSLALSASNAAQGAPTAEVKECVRAADEGQDLREAGQLRHARDRFLSCARDACPGPVKQDCARWVGELDAEIPTIVLRVTRDGQDVSGAVVTIDGEEVPQGVDGKPIALDPGPHAISAKSPDGQERTQSIVLTTGERHRAVTLVFPASPPTEHDDLEGHPDLVDRDRARPSWPWIAGGIGVVALSSFAYFAVTGVREVHRLERECAPFCHDDEVDAAKRRLLFADVSLGISIVALGVAAYGMLSPSREGSDALAGGDESTVRASFSFLRGGALAALQGAF